MCFRPLRHLLEPRAGNHDARRRHPSMLERLDDRAVDRMRHAEVVGVQNEQARVCRVAEAFLNRRGAGRGILCADCGGRDRREGRYGGEGNLSSHRRIPRRPASVATPGQRRTYSARARPQNRQGLSPPGGARSPEIALHFRLPRYAAHHSTEGLRMSESTERAILAGGCFWGMQDLIRRYPGVISTRVGYSGGDVPNATYRNHGSHAEAIEIVFNPEKLSYRKLLEFFFQIHDPTTLNRQGNDRGTSYRSAIFYTSDEQKQIATETIADVDA